MDNLEYYLIDILIMYIGTYFNSNVNLKYCLLNIKSLTKNINVIKLKYIKIYKLLH